LLARVLFLAGRRFQCFWWLAILGPIAGARRTGLFYVSTVIREDTRPDAGSSHAAQFVPLVLLARFEDHRAGSAKYLPFNEGGGFA